ncbi:MAG TPA: hypothetical protein O0X39_00680 [Methanocorpusculum sp.]|nr:hypothetical protein [Methanocorpusculum sp.]
MGVICSGWKEIVLALDGYEYLADENNGNSITIQQEDTMRTTVLTLDDKGCVATSTLQHVSVPSQKTGDVLKFLSLIRACDRKVELVLTGTRFHTVWNYDEMAGTLEFITGFNVRRLFMQMEVYYAVEYAVKESMRQLDFVASAVSDIITADADPEILSEKYEKECLHKIKKYLRGRGLLVHLRHYLPA